MLLLFRIIYVAKAESISHLLNGLTLYPLKPPIQLYFQYYRVRKNKK